MHKFMKVYRLYGRLMSYVAVVAGICVFAMMWLVDINVLARMFFNAPLLGSVEIAQALLVFCIMFGLPFAQTNGAHVRVTILVSRFPRRLREILFALAMLCGSAFFALLTYSSFGFALRSYQVGEAVWGAALRFPLFPVKGAITVGALLISVQFLFDAIRVGLFRQTEMHDEIYSSDPTSLTHV